MTETEFVDWLAGHCCLHPEFHSWLAKFPKHPKERQLGRDDLTPKWFKVLARAGLEDAKEASEAMYRDAELIPRAFSRHAAVVAQLVRRKAAGREAPRPHRVDGQETVCCRECNDDGLIQVWGDASMQAAKDGRLGKRFTIASAVARCRCRAGDNWPGVPMFDPKRLLQVDQLYLLESEEQQKLLDFVAALKPAGYQPEFARFEGT